MADKSGSTGTFNGSKVRGSGVSFKPNQTKAINKANRITNTSTGSVQTPKAVNAMSPSLTSSVTGNQMKSVPARFKPEYKEPEIEPISSFAPTGLASSTGSVTTSEPVSIGDVGKAVDDSILSNFRKKASGLDVWEQQSAERENRPVRTQNYFGEDYNLDGSDFNWIDSQQNYIGNTPTNDTYIRDMIDSGLLSEDDAWAILHKPQSIAEGKEMRESRPGISADVYDGTKETLDDGTGKYFNMTADAMTGTQYLHYRDDLGMGGRSGYIDPNKVYSKRREAVNYGFIPFMPDVSTYGSMITQNLLDAPARIGNAIGDVRHAITPDYKINYEEDGKQKSVSGDAFDESASAFMNQYYHDLKYDPDKYLSAPDNEDYTAFVNQFMIPDANGNETYHYGHLVDVSNTSDGLVQFAFSDGSTIKTTKDFFDSVYENGNVNLDYTPVPTQSVKSMINLDEMRPGRHTAMVNEYVVPDAYGNETYHYGNLVSVDDGPNGTYRFTFEDGSSVDAPESYFNSVYDRNTGNVNVSYNKIFADDAKDEVVYDDEALKPTLKNSDILYLPNMTMSDGTKMRLPDVERLLFDKTPEDDDNERGMSDDDVTYDFSGMGGDSPLSRDVPVVGPILNAVLGGVGKLPVLNGITNRPARLGGQEIITQDKNGNYSVDTSNLVNNAIDWTLGSIPISVPGILPYVYSLSNASRSFSGINPGSYNGRTDSYDLNAGTWDDNGNLRYGVYDLDENGNEVRNDELSNSTRLWNAAGNAIVPVTEQIVGPIGEHNPLGELFGRATDKFTKKIPSYLGRALVNEFVGAGEEGVEEILGNIPEEFTSYGTDMFADPIIDPETGEAMTDQFGHEMRRHNTNVGKRAYNYGSNFVDNGNAFLGGMSVDAVMRQIPTGQAENPSFWPTMGNAILKDRARLLTGVDPGEDIERPMTRNLGRRYASLFDDRGMVVNGEENG